MSMAGGLASPAHTQEDNDASSGPLRGLQKRTVSPSETLINPFTPWLPSETKREDGDGRQKRLLYKEDPETRCPVPLAMNSRSWAACLLSSAALSLLLIATYSAFIAPPEDERQLHRLPQDAICPESASNRTRTPAGSARGGGIFFVETSEKTKPSFQVMCAVESVSRAHPGTKVTVLMKGLSSRNLTLPRNLGFSFLGCFPDVEFRPLNPEELFEETPLSAWYEASARGGRFSDYPMFSDACRLAILWKYGGIYLDMDFIILKNLEGLTNAIGTQSPYLLNGAFLAFGRRHRFMELCMEDFVRDYNAWLYGHQGPQLLTRVFKRWCAVRRLRDSKGCRGVHVLPKGAFYPVDWQDWRRYFEAIDPSEMKRLLRNTYGVHLWNKKSQGVRLEGGSFLDQLQSLYCPETNKLMKMYQ
ncbi:lactosylceramide 4-alpha-galactosyltransferase [Spea bombifrons]|uniref:lactosylceramide 4-alpha-galactosyltransferase n=1 Tax=Spea bombifrons TaxID=233779 RepID=UPI002349444D|nr:lactosylceramide 4-alpha-galactosyltransferase [Spea bombifrons]